MATKKNELYQVLVDTIKRYIPQEETAAAWIANTLKIEKESAYRRLRGNVLFTFEEVAVMSSALGFSLDRVIGSNYEHSLGTRGRMKSHQETMEEYMRFFEKVYTPTGKFRLAMNSMPFFFSLDSEILSKFRLYKWISQKERTQPNFAFSDFELSEDLLQTYYLFYESVEKVPSMTIILDRNLFLSTIYDIIYFYRRGLVNEDELSQLQDGLLKIVDKLEYMASNGANYLGGHIELYLSAIDLDATYLHVEYEDVELCQIRVYSISTMDSQNPRVCEELKNWIESLKKYCVLISQSAESIRYDYLNKQREYIKNMKDENAFRGLAV